MKKTINRRFMWCIMMIMMLMMPGKMWADEVITSIPLIENAFKVEDVGGNMYKITVPLGGIYSDGRKMIVGYMPDLSKGGTSAYLYFKKKGDADYTYLSYYRYHNNTANDISGWWTWWRNGPDAKYGTYYTDNAFLPFSTGYASEFDGNNENLRTATIWFKAANGLAIEKFKVNMNGVVGDTWFKDINVERTPVAASAPDDMNSIAAVDPIIDFTNVDANGKAVAPGKQTLNVYAANQLSHIVLYDMTTTSYVINRDVTTDEKNLVLSIPQLESTHKYAILTNGEKKVTTSTGVANMHGAQGVVYVDAKPFHAIQSLTVNAEKTKDAKGNFSQQNVLTWTVQNVEDKDVIADDEYIIQRAYRSDFSDAVAIGNVSVSTTDSKYLSINKTTGLGTFTFVDKDEEAWYNPKEKDKLSQSIYYRVVRALVLTQWGEGNRGNYEKSAKLELDNILTPVRSVSMTKTPNFDSNKTVKVRVELGNRVLTEGNFEKLREARSSMVSTYKSKDYYIVSSDKDAFLSLKGGKVCLSTEPYSFTIYKGSFGETLTGEDGLGISVIKGESPQLEVGSPADLHIEHMGGLLYSIGRLEYPVDNKWHYIDGEGYGYSKVGWYLVPVEDVKNDESYWTQREIGAVSFWDSSASIKIQRYSTERDPSRDNIDIAAKKITINGSDVKWDNARKVYYAEIEDLQGAPYTHYYYEAVIDAQRSNYPLLVNYPVATTAEEADACYSETLAAISSFKASMGTAKGKVALEWEADEGLLDKFTLERRQVATTNYNGKNRIDNTNTYTFSGLTLDGDLANFYVDEDAMAGKLYEYRLTAMCTVYGKTYSVSQTTYGWNSYKGTLSGKVQMKNGASMPGKVVVTVSSTANISITEVWDADGKNIIIPGYSGKYNGVVFTDNGSFEFNEVPYISYGMNYNVSVSAQGAEFSVAGQDGAKTFVARLENKSCEKTVSFVCSSTRQFSGRVLYDHSTIPVRDCQFLMNGYPVLDGNGKPIVTDSKGSFSLQLPAIPMTLQAHKDGHVFAGRGYILGKNDDPINDKTKGVPAGAYFNPKGDYDGLLLSDSTKIRLVGRLIGGNTQAKLPMGYGDAKNNLGDNLRMVLELEGDNTAQIVYNSENPDQTTRQEQFVQKVDYVRGQTTDTYQLTPTNVSFEKKRIVVEPDVKTGEFCIDLAPTKYKITELSAKGYSTLFSEGEGFQVLDLSNDTTLTTYNRDLKNEYGNVVETQTTRYNATYQRVYHSAVNVTYTPYKYGMKQNWLGSQTITEMNLAGETTTAVVATYDKSKDSTSYVFGYPVYEQGKPYQLEVRAHEDYYYNGNLDTKPDMVYIEGGRLIVRNGMDSTEHEEQFELDNTGRAFFNININNPEFTLTDSEALRALTMQVETNGYYYEAKPLLAFVTGARDKGKDIVTLDSEVKVVDVVRDPYGSGSYAYREAGTHYHWEDQFSFDVNLALKVGLKLGTKGGVLLGTFFGMGAGGWVGTSTDSKAAVQVNTTIPIVSSSHFRNASYDMTLNQRITTSSDMRDVGPMADVYIGAVSTTNLSRVETFSVIDATTYNMVKDAVDAGAIRIVKEGKDANGKPFYLAIGEKLGVNTGTPRTFVYTMSHIVGTLIPNLQQMYKSLIKRGTKAEIQALANASGNVMWRLKDGKTISDSDCYEKIEPKDADGKVIDYEVPAVNPSNCQNMIRQWLEVIAQEEKTKLDAIQSGKAQQSYSLVAGGTIDHTEYAEAYDRNGKKNKILNFDLDKGELSGRLGLDIDFSGVGTSAGDMSTSNNKYVDDGDGGGAIVSFDLPGYLMELKFTPIVKLGVESNQSRYSLNHIGSGYTLATNDNSYLDIDVYNVDPHGVGDGFFGEDSWDFVSQGDKTDNENVPKAQYHEFVYTVRGGAERNPWYEPDSTWVYSPGTPLRARTLKIDQPKLYIDNPVVSNLPVGEKAVFSVRIVNESEVTSNINNSLLHSCKFILILDDTQSPDGAAVTMDGMPITDGREFWLKPGESITKTIQVERSGKAYDYNNIRLVLIDDAASQEADATLSVHYLPSSTPVKIVRPTDKWVMNTLSAQDEQGRYYLPVEINGFDINYDNFDHIELQYKKQTEGDSKWVNLCSYYANDSLYQAASGEKAMLRSGTISQRFYGEMDPVEMAYDLRAVSFCRLGSGYVTKASEVVSGMKDTRVPEVFGKPKPTNGILTYEDVISIPFNEPIAYNYLDETANFQIMGFTNNSDNSYESLLRFDYDEKIHDLPTTKVNRNLTGSDFTLDAMVRLDKQDDGAVFVGIIDDNYINVENPRDLANSENYMMFGFQEDALFLTVEGVSFFSDEIHWDKYKNDALSLENGLTHVAVTYKQTENLAEGEPQVRFFMNGVELGLENIYSTDGEIMDKDLKVTCKAQGKVRIGAYMKGEMSDLRLWDKVLSLSELSARKGKKLSGTEPALLGYWPINEMSGTILYDKANGADMYFKSQQWQMPEGQHSMRIDDEAVDLQNAEEFLRYDFDDYTLSMWVRPDKDMQTDRADGVTLFQSGGNLNDEKFRIYFNENNLMLQSGSKTFSFCPNDQVTDGRWHNLVVVANKSQNTAALYVDGNQTQALSGSELKGMFDQATLGGKGFHGNIDVLTFWHLAFATNNLNLIHNMSPTGYEMGLAYYLPFEMDERNSQNIWQSVFSPYNEVKRLKEDGTLAAKNLAIAAKDGSYASYDDAESFPAVKTLTGLTNLPFTWTSTNNELQINVKKNDSEINHQQLFVTVRGVEDLAGNSLRNPQMMMVYVDRNVLIWDKKTIDVKIPYGSGTTINAGWSNKSGRIISYTIENNNSWLKLSSRMGVAQPLSSENIEFEISDGLAPGDYTATVYLIDESQLSSPITLNVKVEASEPDRDVVNNESYRYTMNVMGRLKIRNEGGAEYYDMDKRDVVYALYNGICVGKTHLDVDNERNISMVNLTIYGNDKMIEEGAQGKADIGFVLWRASTNETSILQAGDNIGMAFRNNAMVGCPPEEPVIFTLNNDFKQLIPLQSGWNWISFNVNPKRDKGLNSLFESNTTFTPGDRIVFGGMTAELVRDADGRLTWSGNYDDLDNHVKRVYQIYVQKPSYATVFGSAFAESERVVNVKAGTSSQGRWNDLPYLLTVDQPINFAMSDFAKDKAKVGSVVKSRKLFAVMGNDGEWVGSLDYMHPGEGYYLRYMGNADTDIKFTNTNVSAKNKNAAKASVFSLDDVAEEETPDLILTQGGEHSSSMPVIAELPEEENFVDGDQIVAYAAGELSGMADKAVEVEGKKLFFISLNAEQNDAVRFAHVRDGKVLAKSTNGITYNTEGIAGSLDKPFVIDFSADSIESIYDLNGIKLTKSMLNNRRGVFIINGEKKMK